MPLTDEEWAWLSTAHNDWVDDVGDVLEGLADAAEAAERSLEGEALGRAVVSDLRRRLDAAVREIVERTNEMTLRVSALQRDLQD
jgi:hypothetical protein